MNEAGPLPSQRRIRFVCVSDTHNASPRDGCFKLPPGDVLIHAGDLTNQGTLHELESALEWIGQSDYEAKIVIAGNHDITLDAPYYAEQGANFHSRYPQSSAACIELISKHPSITYLNHESQSITLKGSDGRHTTFEVFGSPYSPRSGNWAFSYEPLSNVLPGFEGGQEADKLWSRIPLSADVVVTHTPPRNHCDGGQGRSCEALRRALWRVRPKLAVCGHIHEAWGVQRVSWELNDEQVRWKEAHAEAIGLDKEGKKLAKVDLTGRVGKFGKILDNDGSIGDINPGERHKKMGDTHHVGPQPLTGGGGLADADFATAVSEDEAWRIPPSEPSPGVIGLGGLPDSGRCDRMALFGRSGRKETCVVNAAIMAKSRGSGEGRGAKYNKPVVVDIDFPYNDKAKQRDD